MPQLTKIRVSRWVLGVDLAATRQAFATLAASDVPETCCDCQHRQNFAAAQPTLYPPDARELFGRLGMDARYPSEVVHYNQTRPGLHYYGGWFHFIGKLLDGGALEDSAGNPVDARGNLVRDFEPFGDNFALRFTTRFLPKPKVFSEQPVVALEFETTVPWVLDAPEPI